LIDFWVSVVRDLDPSGAAKTADIPLTTAKILAQPFGVRDRCRSSQKALNLPIGLLAVIHNPMAKVATLPVWGEWRECVRMAAAALLREE
jgi:hypothetical protein